MAIYEKITDMAAASALDGTELFEGVQSGTSKKVTSAQIKTYVDGTGVANTTPVAGAFIFTDGNELDVSGQFSSGQASAATVLTGVPSSATGVLLYVELENTGTYPRIEFSRSSGSSAVTIMGAAYADVGTNKFAATQWIAVNSDTIYVRTVVGDSLVNVVVFGYMIG